MSVSNGIKNTILIFISLIIGYLIFETGFRAYLYYYYTVKTNYEVSTANARTSTTEFQKASNLRGIYRPGTITFTRYKPSGDMYSRIQVPVNNLGWVSRNDYHCQKLPSEYRIAIVGDSMTASINNEIPWPDVLQNNLNADSKLLKELGVEKISVLNLGIAGASMQFIANPLSVIARRFTPDLIIVNFPIDDIARRHADPSPMPAEPPCTDESFQSVPTSNVTNMEGHLIVDGIEIPLFCASAPVNVNNPTCKVSPAWYVPPHITLDKAGLNLVKKNAARLILWHRVVLSLKPLALLDLLGRPVIARAHAQPLPLTMASGIEAEDISIGVRALQYIKSIHDEVLITHNTLYWHLTGERRPAVLDKFIGIARKAGIRIINTEDYMPIQRGKRDWYLWYNLPEDGHWSNYGAEVYAEVMHKIIRERLLRSTGEGVNRQNPCLIAFGTFNEAQTEHRLGRSDKALALYEEALTAVPSNITPEINRDCGFVADLHQARGVIFSENGETENAFASWKSAIRADPNHLPTYVELGKAYSKLGQYKTAAANFREAVRIRPNDHTLLYHLATGLFSSGNDSEAIEVYSKALEVHPTFGTALLQRARARHRIGEYEKAVADFTQAIEFVPLAQVYKERAMSYSLLGNSAKADADLLTATEISNKDN